MDFAKTFKELSAKMSLALQDIPVSQPAFNSLFKCGLMN